MAETTIKIFIGTDAAGKRLKKAVKEIADGKSWSMSKLLILAFCDKYGYDRKSGKPVGAQSKNLIGNPPGTHYDSPLLNDEERKK